MTTGDFEVVRPKSTRAERFQLAFPVAFVLPGTGALSSAHIGTMALLVVLGAIIGGAIDGEDLRSRAIACIPFLLGGVALAVATPISIEMTGGAAVGIGTQTIWAPQVLPAMAIAGLVVVVARRLLLGTWPR